MALVRRQTLKPRKKLTDQQLLAAAARAATRATNLRHRADRRTAADRANRQAQPS